MKDNLDGNELQGKSIASSVTHNNIITANRVIINYHNNGSTGLSGTTPNSPQNFTAQNFTADSRAAVDLEDVTGGSDRV